VQSFQPNGDPAWQAARVRFGELTPTSLRPVCD
jgi:hypothetical protein